MTKFVVRLLDAEDALIAWAEVHAEPKPQDRGASCPFWPVGPAVPYRVEKSGIATRLSVHWCDLDVARVQNLDQPTRIDMDGPPLSFAFLAPIWLVPGMRDVPLPAVTVGSQSIKPLIGSMNQADGRQ